MFKCDLRKRFVDAIFIEYHGADFFCERASECAFPCAGWVADENQFG